MAGPKSGAEPLIRVVDGKRQFLRLTFNQRVQHFFLATSVLALVISGMPLKFHDRSWALAVAALMGGVDTARLVHRGAGLVLMVLSVYHVAYLARNIYRDQLKPMREAGTLGPISLARVLLTQPLMPNLKDLKDIWGLLLYLVYLRRERPHGDKFRWIEKFDYLAPTWGMVVIGLSGMMMLDVEASSWLFPGVFLNFALIAHSEEALLAAMFLVVWHWYNVHYSPAVFPQSPTYITGYQSEELMREEHYLEYQRVMKEAGLEDEILPPHGVGEPEPPRFSLPSLLHTAVFGSVVIFMMTVVWQETFAHIVHYAHEQHELAAYAEELEALAAAGPDAQAPEEEEPSLEELLAMSDDPDHDLGHRVALAEQGPPHFHGVDVPHVRDERSACIACHGDIPHDKVKETRAFWNMHAVFVACETCHMRFDDDAQPGVYTWYDRATGAIVEDPVVGENAGPELAKIVPFEPRDGILQRVDSDKRIQFAADYRRRLAREDLTEQQKSLATKAVHNDLAEEPYACLDCHRPDEQILDYRALGYSEVRIDGIVGNEVAGMVEKYDTFFIPSLFSAPRPPAVPADDDGVGEAPATDGSE